MSKKITDLDAAATLDGSEQLEVVQGGANKKVTVNDLLPVQLQEAKTIDLNGSKIDVRQGGQSFLLIDPTVDAENSFIGSINNTGGGNASGLSTLTPASNAQFQLGSNFNDGQKVASIYGFADTTGSSIAYSADNHVFIDLVAKDFVNDAAAAVGLVPVGGLYHSMGTLKIRLS